ncbi:MAG TPA: response regulator [Gemmatimonadales bacterium]|nr:response regulator [Gemmatimonadales bacterium]
MTDLPRVAVVEDNTDNRLLLQALLADRYTVDEYESGPAALAGCAAAPPRVILLDFSLPGMDGAEVLRRLRNDPALARIPVIALTAHAMSGDRERFLEMGFDGYVTKPIIDETILYGAIARLLAGRPEGA